MCAPVCYLWRGASARKTKHCYIFRYFYCNLTKCNYLCILNKNSKGYEKIINFRLSLTDSLFVMYKKMRIS